MLLNFAMAIMMMAITTALHAAGMTLVMRMVELKPGTLRAEARRRRVYTISGIIIFMFCVSLFEVLFWAIPYLALGALNDFEEAVYFSMVTYTTLGYGDVLLDVRWRLLSSFEAANGIIMFGWTTAIVMAVIKKVYYGRDHI